MMKNIPRQILCLLFFMASAEVAFVVSSTPAFAQTDPSKSSCKLSREVLEKWLVPGKTFPEKMSLATLCDQASQSFTNKFSRITSHEGDIYSLSAKNLDVLGNAFAEFRGMRVSDFKRALKKTEKTWHRLRVTHQTGIDSALAILKSGEFLSLDELVRREILRPLSKVYGSRISHEISGPIGEQDVVFLAIRGQECLAPDDCSSGVYFGNVEFEFDRAVIDLGYFSLFILDQYGACEFGNAGISPLYHLYGASVFSGQAALREVLAYSKLQLEWEEQPHFFDKLQKSFSFAFDFLHQPSAFQIYEDDFPYETYFSNTFSRSRFPDLGLFWAAYRYPQYSDDLLPRIATVSSQSNFVELKIPTRLSTQWVRSITAYERIPELESAAQDLARSMRKKLVVDEFAGRRFVYRFE